MSYFIHFVTKQLDYIVIEDAEKGFLPVTF
jgi:hypothetical protein